MSGLVDLLKVKADEYKPLTFWSLNNELETKRLDNQIKMLYESGFGGFFLHARSGLKTKYMSEKWHEVIEFCIRRADELGMQAWIYDENGYPSGFAGKKLLQKKKYLTHYLTCEKIKTYDKNALVVFGVSSENMPIILSENNEILGNIYAIYDNECISTADVFNIDTVKEFIKYTHNEYKNKHGKYFGNAMPGFFTDEPQYYRYKTPYSRFLSNEYKNKYGENIIDCLPYLFLDFQGKEKFRYRYYKLVNDLYTKNFAATIYDWCHKNDTLLTGHTIEESALNTQMWCCAGVMPFYEYEDIPGCDWLGRMPGNQLNPKQVGSVAVQLGKKRTITESFACSGWDVTPRELKRLVDWQFANGINTLCTHLTPYSLEGSRKYDHPVFSSDCLPWFDDYKYLCEYVKNLGCLMGESTENVSVGVIHPIHSAYLIYNRKDDEKSVEWLQKDFEKLLNKLEKYNIPYHFIDETILAKYGSIKENKVCLGKCSYEYIVIPSMNQIDEFTAKILSEYMDNGGKMFLFGTKPTYISGEEGNTDFLKSNIEFNDLISKQFKADNYDNDIFAVLRNSSYGDFFFVFNKGEKTETVEYTVRTNGIKKFDLLTMKEETVYFRENDDKTINFKITLNPCESCLFMLGEYEKAKCEEKEYEKIDLGNLSLVKKDDNILVIDVAQYSFDGQKFSDFLPLEGISELMISNHYKGKLYLKYQFSADYIPKVLKLEVEKMNAEKVLLNGVDLVDKQKGKTDPDFTCYDVSSMIKIGENKVIFEIDYCQDNSVYEIVDNIDESSESLINCLTYTTELAPITVFGDFSVKGQNEYFDKKQNVFCFDYPFTIVNPNEINPEKITESGYPFFAGSMTFSTECDANVGKSVKLKLGGRFATAEIRWNDYHENLIFLDTVVIPAEYVKEKNKLEITIKNGNRNHFGPFHNGCEKEPKTVWVGSFRMNGTWKDAKSHNYRDEYAFVPFGIEIKANIEKM